MHRALASAACGVFVMVFAPSIDARADNQTESSGAALQEVVVTAERRQEDLQKASLTIEVLSGGQLASAGVSNPADLTTVTTGVDIGEGGVNDQIFIRGVGSFAYSPLSTPGVAFNVDGIYVGRPDGIGSNFYDIERVEVLKGPQGTLYGRNANGGSINVITNEPQLGNFSGYVNTEFGNYDLTHVDGAVNVPLGGISALRGAFNVVYRNGYLSDGTDDDVQQAGRLRYKLVPNDVFSLMLNGDYSHLGGNGPGSVWLPRPPGADPWQATTSPASNAYMHSFLPLGPLVDSQIPDSYQNSSFYNFSARADWKTPIGTLTVLPAFRHAEINALTYNGLRYTEKELDEQRTLEARLGDSGSHLTWVLGGYYFDESNGGTINVFQSDILQNYLIGYSPDTRSYAAFGQTTVTLLPRLRLIAGGRYTYEKDELSGAINNLATTPTSVIEAFGGRHGFSGITYKGGLEFDLAAANMLYATYSSGFKSGGFSQTVPPLNVFQPEKLYALEVGSRNRFFNNRLQINISGYHWLYKNLQDQRVNFDPLGNVNFITYNSGDATISGGDLEFIARPIDTDMVAASVEYAHSRYDSYWFQTPAPLFQATSSGCRITGPYAPGASLPYIDSDGNGTNIDPLPIVVGNCAGMQVARVPEWTGTGSYDHVFTLSGHGSIDAGLRLKFSSARWLNIDFVPAERAGGYALLDADVYYRTEDGHWVVGLFGRNLANRAYYTGGLEQTFVGGLFAANIGAPRTYGLNARYAFGP